MSLYKRKDSSFWWVKLTVLGRPIQRSTGTEDKVRAQEYHDRLKVELWEEQRLGRKPSRPWSHAAGRWIEETSDKATHKEDVKKLKWLHPFLGHLKLEQVTLQVIDQIREAKLKEATDPRPTVIWRWYGLF